MNTTYEPRISTGNILTIVFGVVAAIAAYWTFVGKTSETIATHNEKFAQHEARITELEEVLKTMPTRDQVNHLKDSIGKVEADLDWLVKREIEKNGD